MTQGNGASYIGMREVMDIDDEGNYWVHAIIVDHWLQNASYLVVSPSKAASGGIYLKLKGNSRSYNREAVFLSGKTMKIEQPKPFDATEVYIAGD